MTKISDEELLDIIITAQFKQADKDPFNPCAADECKAILEALKPYLKREMVPLKRALELLQEWHDLHFESNRTLDADDTAARTQKFLIETDIEVQDGSDGSV